MMEKLNKLERLKSSIAPFDFDIKDIDLNNLNEEERFYLKNYGIYNIKLRPDDFMFRLRIDGGRVERSMLGGLAEYAKINNLKLLITARAQIEVHGIGADMLFDAYNHIRSIGFETMQTLTDNFRAIVTDPYDGVASDSEIECMPIIEDIRDKILGKHEWMGMIPRKFNTALIGREVPVVNPWSNDLLFALAQKDGKYGFNIYLGGKNSHVAKNANIFVLPHWAAEFFISVAKVYSKHGYRGSRSKNRLFFLIEKLGMGAVREMVELEFGEQLDTSGELKMKSARPSRYTPIANGKSGKIIQTHNGEISPGELLSLISDMNEDEELRLGSDQNIHLLSSDLFRSSGDKVPNITFCAGVRYCPLSLWDIKNDAAILPLERLRDLGVSVGFSGCLKGCGRHLHSDIGLVGLRTNLYGDTEKALRVYIGATQGEDGQPARLLYYSVPERSFGELVEVMLDGYESSGCSSFEEFSRVVLSRFDDEFLQLWFLLKIIGTDTGELSSYKTQDEAVEVITRFYPDIEENTSNTIRNLTHKIWDRQ